MQKYLSNDFLSDLDCLLRKELEFSTITLHGFLTAIASSLHEPPACAWLDYIGLSQIEFPNSNEAQRFIGGIFILYSAIVEQLDGGTFAPKLTLSVIEEFANNAEKIAAATQWAEGYLEGVCMCHEDWFTGDHKQDMMIQTLLYPMTMLCLTDAEAKEMCAATETNIDLATLKQEAVELLATAANQIYDYWTPETDSCEEHDVCESACCCCDHDAANQDELECSSKKSTAKSSPKKPTKKKS